MKISEIFKRDIKREFSDITKVNHQIKASDIDEYVVTENIEDILGCFLAHFFDTDKFPQYAKKARLVREKYSSGIGPGVWLRGPFGCGKSQFLAILYILFTVGSIDYKDAKGNTIHLNIIIDYTADYLEDLKW
jgi:predicted ATPase